MTETDWDAFERQREQAMIDELEPTTCAESGCTAPRRQLLRYRGGTYLSDWCWEHGCVCIVCHGEIDDGEDLCEYHSELFGVRYESDLPDVVRQGLLAGTSPLLPPPDPAG